MKGLCGSGPGSRTRRFRLMRPARAMALRPPLQSPWLLRTPVARAPKEPGHRIEGVPFQRRPGPGEMGKQKMAASKRPPYSVALFTHAPYG